MNGESASAGNPPRTAFIPGLLLAVAVIGWSAFQTQQLVIERNNLGTAITEQTPQMEQSKNVRDRLESIATRIARVARSGNANATIIVEELRKRGITINPDKPSAEAAPANQP